jgi:site-specific DNA-methyltransferase (adenine-specific)
MHWNNITRLIQARRRAGEQITIQKWAQNNAPVSARWLYQYGEFANRWNAFLDAWKWALANSYAPERRPGLHALQDLLSAKQRHDMVSLAHQVVSGRQRGREPLVTSLVNSVHKTDVATSQIEMLTHTTGLIYDDVAAGLRQRLTDGVADVVIADPPYWLSRYYQSSGADRNYVLAGMTPRFDADWDHFDSVEHYEREAEGWLDQIMRCLAPTGSAFILGSYHNSGLINRLCQMKDYFIINEIAWIVRNSRPNAARMTLQASHHTILWLAKQKGRYRFNYRQIKLTEYAGDHFAQRGRQMRTIWDIPHNPSENRRYGHPSPKPLALYARMLDVAGRPGGMLIDAFSGSGTGAIAAARWEMECIAVERDPTYCDMIRRRVADELSVRQ